ncbi:MAG: dihydrofolate reductase family protein [Actinomycetota bacterium]|nr:dihydrofolate reductase family protein [Actinomycetota bacterium]
MRQLIVSEFVSLDGVMEAPGGEAGYAHSGWVADFFNDELGAYKQEEQLAADILLLGRKTYGSFYGAWPSRDGAMADKINTMPKFVASTTLKALEWETARLLKLPVTAAVAELKRGDGGAVLVVGSRTLVHTLLDAGLVDELHLQVFPIILGSGARLYPEDPATTALTLASSTTLSTGVLLLSYNPIPGPQTAR